MNDLTYVSPEKCALRLKYSTRYFRGIVMKRDLIEDVHFIRAFNGRKILLIWELVEAELLKGVRAPVSVPPKQNGIPMARGGFCNV